MITNRNEHILFTVMESPLTTLGCNSYNMSYAMQNSLSCLNQKHIINIYSTQSDDSNIF